MSVSIKDIRFVQPIPTHHVQPVGLLPTRTEAYALWYFLVCAHQAYSRVESQKTLETDEDQQVDVLQLANSIRQIYKLNDLEGMFNPNLIGLARQEAIRCCMPWDDRLDAFFQSGGKSYRHLDRDADKVSN